MNNKIQTQINFEIKFCIFEFGQIVHKTDINYG